MRKGYLVKIFFSIKSRMKRGSGAKWILSFLPASFLLLSLVVSSPVGAQTFISLTVQNQRISADTFYFDVYLNSTTVDEIHLCHSDFIFDFDFSNFENPDFGYEFGSPVLVNSLGSTTTYYDGNIGTLFGKDYNFNQLVVTVVPPTINNQTDFDTRIAVIDNTPGVHRLGTFYVTGIIDATDNPDLQWVDDQDRGLNTQVFTMNPVTHMASSVPTAPSDPQPTSAPSTPASNLVFSDVATSSMSLSWTNGNGGNRLVLARASSPVGTNIPADGIMYQADTIFGSGSQIGESGTYIIYNGSGNTVNISGLDQNTPYYFAVYEYNGGNGQTENYMNSGLEGDTITQSSFVTVNVKVFLGNYNSSTGLMTNALNTNNAIPVNQPYSGSPFSYSGTEQVGASFYASNTSIVDWVLVQLRSTATGATVATRACFLKNNGTVVDTDGVSLPRFYVATDSYYVVIRHRNHLGIMSANKLLLSANSTQYDFTTALSQAYSKGGTQLKQIGSAYCMISGDGDGSGRVNVLDYIQRYRVQNGTVGYQSADFDLSWRVNVLDYILHYRANNGLISQIP